MRTRHLQCARDRRQGRGRWVARLAARCAHCGRCGRSDRQNSPQCTVYAAQHRPGRPPTAPTGQAGGPAPLSAVVGARRPAHSTHRQFFLSQDRPRRRRPVVGSVGTFVVGSSIASIASGHCARTQELRNRGRGLRQAISLAQGNREDGRAGKQQLNRRSLLLDCSGPARLRRLKDISINAETAMRASPCADGWFLAAVKCSEHEFTACNVVGRSESTIPAARRPLNPVAKSTESASAQTAAPWCMWSTTTPSSSLVTATTAGTAGTYARRLAAVATRCRRQDSCSRVSDSSPFRPTFGGAESLMIGHPRLPSQQPHACGCST